MNGVEWIGVDLDGTLAEYNGFQGHDKIGPVIEPMKERVLRWIDAGIKVKIFTARASGDVAEIAQAKHYISKWLEENGFPALEITNVKDYYMTELYDDRAVQVEFNTGRLIGTSTRKYKRLVTEQEDPVDITED
jgi:hydroxymethylpyrimidine pyrophosphatase-like HAD family hydrolase